MNAQDRLNKILSSAESDINLLMEELIEDARNEGYEDGHKDGFDEGEKVGYDNGYEDGKSDNSK